MNNGLQFFLLDAEGKEYGGSLKELRAWVEANREMLNDSWEGQDDKPELAVDVGGSENTDGVEVARIAGDSCRQFLIQLLEL